MCNHSVSSNTNPTHKRRACWVVRQVAKQGINILDNLGTQKSRGRAPSWEEQSSDDDEVLMLYETNPSPHETNTRELFERSTALITWYLGQKMVGQADHLWARKPTSIKPRPRSQGLVLDPIIDCYRLTEVLMDGSSSLTLNYEDTLE